MWKEGAVTQRSALYVCVFLDGLREKTRTFRVSGPRFETIHNENEAWVIISTFGDET
jgi:hypothetical protein